MQCRRLLCRGRASDVWLLAWSRWRSHAFVRGRLFLQCGLLFLQPLFLRLRLLKVRILRRILLSLQSGSLLATRLPRLILLTQGSLWGHDLAADALRGMDLPHETQIARCMLR